MCFWAPLLYHSVDHVKINHPKVRFSYNPVLFLAVELSLEDIYVSYLEQRLAQISQVHDDDEMAGKFYLLSWL